MSVDYSKLWKLLIDKRMNKTQLREAAELSTNVMAKLGKNESVSLSAIEKICSTLNCSLDDVLSFVENKSSEGDVS